MTIYQIKLLDRQIIAEGTMSFIFEKPKGFIFKAGQCGDFTLFNPKETDEEGNTRCFSLTSAPCTDKIEIATRMRDTAFKRVLKTLPLGMILKFVAPSGSFTLHNNKEIPAVFLTGGIGITPVRSIVTQATKDKLPHQIYLFYSNKRPEDAAFLDELATFETENNFYKFIPTMTAMEKSKQPWNGEKGYVNREMLEKYINDLTKPIFYISGPSTMVAAMRKMLNESDINDDNIRTEEFSGY
jgi:ferredoxin-NADP reductase